jgi:hypothetical protein
MKIRDVRQNGTLEIRHIHKQREDCTVYRVRNATGTGEMTDYPVFPGIHLKYNDFHIESEYNNKLYYMTSGDFSCASKDCVEQSSVFPSVRYGYCRQRRIRYSCGLIIFN